MNSLMRVCPVAALLAALLSASPTGESAAGAYRNRPLVFEPHRPAVGGMPWFTARASGRNLLFGPSGMVSEWALDARASGAQPGITMRLAGARGNVIPQAVGPQAGSANHLVGSGDRWRLGVPLFEKIRYAGLYPGIDLIYYGDENRVEYDFVVAPGASWRSIRLEFTGAQAIEIDKYGDLKVQTGWGRLRHRRPRVYQQSAAGRREVPAHFVLKENRQAAFEVGVYDPSLPLVIDPTLTYSSYLGGNADDYGYSVALGNSGCAYTVGETWSANFPLLNPEQSVPAGDTDIFVTKWNAAGTGILYSTYIGGRNRDVPLDIAVDAAGNAYIAGFTYSADFPITSGALRTGFSGQSKAFVLKLNPSGDSLIFATFLGGSGDDYATGIAVDSTGQAYLSGYTASVDFPVSAKAFQRAYGGGAFDGFFAKLNAAGSQLLYATYLGGMGNDTAFGVALDPGGDVYVTGQTQSSNFPTYQPLQTTEHESDAFVVKLNASDQVLYSTYLGGTGLNTGTGIAADAAGNAYVVGYTIAPDFPVTSNAYQPGNGGGYDAFVAKLSADGSTILSATYFGGTGAEGTAGIALDGSGNVFITGSTNSMDLPLQAPVQASYGGGGDAFVAAFNNQLSSLYFSTYFGGAENETGAGIAVDSSGNAYLAGSTNSGPSALGIPITTGAFQTTAQGGSHVFLAKFSASASGAALSCGASTPTPLNIPVNGPSGRVGDIVLSCTGGTADTLAVTDVQVTLNSNVASGAQPQLLIDNPPPASQVPNVNVFAGVLNGANSITFAGISFNAPGPSAVRTLRMTNIQVDASTIPSPGQVIATVSALNSSPPLTVIQPQQTVARAPELIWQSNATRQVTVNYFGGPDGATQTAWNWLDSAGAPGWTVVGTGDFDGDGVPDLVWQNDSTHQVVVHYYGGAGEAVYQGWAYLDAAGVPGWTVVGVADMNGDGVPDLIWQNTATTQVVVHYYGGAGGAVYQGWAYLDAAGARGWTVVGAADFDGNGTPDLVWQNTTTTQVVVHYYGYSGGAPVYQGWAYLDAVGAPGWTVVGASDFDGNGVPDLVWQNSATTQVVIHYYGGPGGAVLQGWSWLNSIGAPGWRATVL